MVDSVAAFISLTELPLVPDLRELADNLRESHDSDDRTPFVPIAQAAAAPANAHHPLLLEMANALISAKQRPVIHIGQAGFDDIMLDLLQVVPKQLRRDVEFSRQNLWVVDERLAYHTYLASDLPMARFRAVNAAGGDEPDLAVFNTARAFSETKSPFQSVVIVEFKRPERNEYPARDESPVDQVLRYVRKIKEGQAKARTARPLTWAQFRSMPISCAV